MTKKSLSPSSRRWLERNKKDLWVKQAKKHGYKSRAAFKLLEMQEKESILFAGATVLELGGAPGGWSKVISETIGETGKIFCVDRLSYDVPDNAELLIIDIHEEEAIANISQSIAKGIKNSNKVKVILGDLNPSTSGIASLDHLRSSALNDIAFEIALENLAKDGTLLLKALQGEEEQNFLKKLRASFAKVKRLKPSASRKESREFYWLAKNFIA